MKANVAEKEKSVEQMTEKLKQSSAVYLVDYLGLTVEEVNTLRRQLRDNNIYYKVYKNTLLKRAFSESGLEDAGQHLAGPTALAIAEEDEVAPAKVIAEFANKQKEKLPRFKTGILDGKIISEEEIKAVAKLPGKTELLGMLANALNAPATKLAQTLNACISQIAYAVNAVKEKKEQESN